MIPTEHQLQAFGNVPFTHGALLPLLAGYRRPNDKISDWLAKGILLQLKRGLYVLNTPYRSRPVSKGLVSNLLYGPSYVSLDSALSWHGLIPEGVSETSAVTPRRARHIDTPFGHFSYTRLPQAFYAIGITMQTNPDGTSYLMASPEKALCDKVALTRQLQACNSRAMQAFLFEDLRIEPDALESLDTNIITQCLQAGFKSRQLAALYKVVEQCQ